MCLINLRSALKKKKARTCLHWVIDCEMVGPEQSLSYSWSWKLMITSDVQAKQIESKVIWKQRFQELSLWGGASTTLLSLACLYLGLSSSSLRARSAVMEFNVVVFYTIVITHFSTFGRCILHWVSLLAFCKLCCFLLHPFHALINAKHLLVSPDCLGSSCHFIHCCCPFKFLLPELLLPTSSSSFSSSFHLPAREQVRGSQNSTLCHS